MCRQRTKNNNKTVKELTENEETSESNESMSESEESINHLEEIKTIANRQKQNTAVVRKYGIKKDFVIETVSPVTKMPPDERMMGKTEILKIPNR